MVRILHLEDCDDDADLICDVLNQGVLSCQLTRVETRKTFLEAMDQGDWDIILADYSLPLFDGISALKLAVEKRPDIPFIFVTGALGEERAVEILKNGATDYIPKHRLVRLPLAITRAMHESESAKSRMEAEQKLKDSLREKVLLLQEVHHRVNNNLEIICGLLSMQSEAVNDPLLAAALLESQSRIHSIAKIHAMLYDSSSLKDIDFAEYTHLLAAEVSQSYGIDASRIRLSFEMEPIRLGIDRAIPCGLVLNELLSNAFKHAFPSGRSGEIRISLRQQEGRIRLAVEDTGVGLNVGRAPSQRKSIGLNIIKILARQLGGSVEIASSQGSQFVLEFSQPH
jgi:two-component sensor histidine kinase/CheY-like chemotaxis protein